MEELNEQPKITAGIPKTSEKITDRLFQASTLKGAPISDLELYAFGAVLVLMYVASCIIPQNILDAWELSILFFVVLPFLVWAARVILKTS